MVYKVSHIEGRTRLKFPDIYEKESFIINVKDIKGLKRLGTNGNSLSLTVLVEYEPRTPFDYVLKNMMKEEAKPLVSRHDISSYVSPVLTNPLAKALWLVTVLGPSVGILQFGISSMIVNRYIKAKFG